MLNNRIWTYFYFVVISLCILVACHSTKVAHYDNPKHMKMPKGGDHKPPPPPPPPMVMDRDGDGINDDVDKCPDVPGVARYQGCPIPDTDGDGVNDEEDKCPTVPGPRSNFGCPVIVTQVVSMKQPSKKVIVEHKNNDEHHTQYKGANIVVGKQEKDGEDPNLPSPDKTIVPVTKKSAALSISFPFEMKQDETRDLRVFISIRFPESRIKEELKKIQRSEMAFSDIQTKDTIITRVIDLYKNLTVKIVYDPKDIEVTRIKGNEKQLVDSVHGNYWYWHVKAISDKPMVMVTVSVNAEKYEGDTDDLSVTNIPINIKIDNVTGLRKAWNWLIHNPGYSIPSILVPFILFLFKRKKAAPSKP